jgi:hypothetical protein
MCTAHVMMYGRVLGATARVARSAHAWVLVVPVVTRQGGVRILADMLLAQEGLRKKFLHACHTVLAQEGLRYGMACGMC